MQGEERRTTNRQLTVGQAGRRSDSLCLSEDENGRGVEEKAETEEEGHLERRRDHDGE